jgi:Domain of unknown function (DUF4166)
LFSGLYAQLLGERWGDLTSVVRKLHGDQGIVCAAGAFRIRHGDNPIARLMARLAQLPAQGEAANLRLIVAPSLRGERWQRFFAGKPFTSMQRACDRLLTEQIGPIEIRFELDVSDGGLRYETKSVALRIGLARIPLPRWLAPRVRASEKPAGDAVRIAVEVQLPLLGLLIAYEGTLTRIEAKSCLLRFGY